MVAQIRRSAVSICANIAEGGKKSTKDFARFLEISEGSLEETKYHLILSRDLIYVKSSDYEKLMQQCNEISRMLYAFRKRLINSLTLVMLSEFELIDEIKKSAASSKDVIHGIGDDTAVLRQDGSKYLLLTTDMFCEGVHFQKGVPARGIGHKAMACNLSDIAAMGGIPKYAVVSIGLPRRIPPAFVNELYCGINALARQFGVAIVGGDTITSKGLIINIALTGEVEKKDLVLRKGARVGDCIFVTGPLGRAWKTDKHLSFVPRINQARFLVEHFKPSAMIDISDGLAGDLGHILELSRTGALIAHDDIPLNPGAKLRDAIYDGEDYELLFTLAPAKAQALMAWQETKRRWFFYPIGTIEKSRGLRLLKSDGRKENLEIKGFTHF